MCKVFHTYSCANLYFTHAHHSTLIDLHPIENQVEDTHLINILDFFAQHNYQCVSVKHTGGMNESRSCGGVLHCGADAGRFEEGDRKEQHIPSALLAIVPTLKATQCFFHSSIGSYYQPPDNENTGCLLQ